MPMLDVALVIIQQIRLTQIVAYFFRDQFGLGGRLTQLVAQFFEHHHEFIAAQPRHAVTLAHTGLQPARHLDQQQVAHRMALRVIDRLEVIHIQKQQCARPAATRADRHRMLQTIPQQAAVRQMGQRIVESQTMNIFFRLLALGNVADEAAEFVLARCIDRGDGQFDG